MKFLQIKPVHSAVNHALRAFYLPVTAFFIQMNSSFQIGMCFQINHVISGSLCLFFHMIFAIALSYCSVSFLYSSIFFLIYLLDSAYFSPLPWDICLSSSYFQTVLIQKKIKHPHHQNPLFIIQWRNGIPGNDDLLKSVPRQQ